MSATPVSTTPISDARPGCVILMLNVVGTAIAWLAAAMIVSWLTGRVLTDRYAWSQWLWWIPTPAMTLPLILGLGAAMRPTRRSGQRRMRVIRWAACAVALLMYFSFVEHRMWRGMPVVRPTAHALKLVHWNAEPAVWANMEPSIDEIIKLNGDVTILTNPSGLLQHEHATSWIEGGLQVASAGPFAVATRLPIITMRLMIYVDGVSVVLMELGGSGLLDRPLVMYLIDMPSDPNIHRTAEAMRVRRLLDDLKAPPADTVVGDLNIPRGSHSIEVMFPGLHDAFDESGHGYGATYYRPYPLYHLDHVLLNADLKSVRYDIIDPGLSRHRAQVAWIVTAKPR